MRKVEKAVLYPQSCAISGKGTGPFIDTGVTIPPGRDYRLYIRATVIQEAAAKLDMVPKSDLDSAHAEIERLEAEKQKNSKTVEASKRLLDAVAEARKTKPRKATA